MKMNTYRIYYKAGNTLDCKAYDMELANGKLYQTVAAGFGNDAPIVSVIDGSKIERIECIEEAKKEG